MIMASNAQEDERAAVAQRDQLDREASELGRDVLSLTYDARQYVLLGDPVFRVTYRQHAASLNSFEERLGRLRGTGVGPGELDAIKEAVRWADALRDEQQEALEARQSGRADRAREIMFGAGYERQFNHVEALIERFESRLAQRTDLELVRATRLARLWKTTSELAICVTGLLFLGVLFFVFRQRVLRPVVKLSDVVTRLAAQDYAVEPPDVGRIDEIGDMVQAIRIFRENGLDRQRLEAERDADLRLRELMSRMTQRMQACDTLLDLKDVVRRFIPQIAPLHAGALYLLDKKRNVMVASCSWLDPLRSREEFSPTACWALRRGLPHRPTGEVLDVPCDHLDLESERLDVICAPLMVHRELLGLLYFEPSSADHRGDPMPQTYLMLLAENISLALANLQLRETLRGLAMSDALTGLPNRRSLDAVLQSRLVEAEKLNRPLSCLMLDVDHFKRFNDTFGHDAGDTVLRHVGGELDGAVRESGMAFRYGGEEFLLLLPGFGPEQAAARAEEIRQRVEALHVKHAAGPLGTVTVSIGLASTPAHCSAADLIRVADAALLRAKASGRNRVEAASRRRKPIASPS